jgi:hypothetical protein
VNVGEWVAELERPGDGTKAEISRVVLTRTKGNLTPFAIMPNDIPTLLALLEHVQKSSLPALLAYGQKQDEDE